MLLRNKLEIEYWLKKYEIKNFELIEDKEYSYIVNVNGDVNLSGVRLKSIDIKFNIVKGNFVCNNNNLKSLEGCPKIVEGNFNCSVNNLKTLEGCPEIVKKNFNCSFNIIKTLKECPKEIYNGNFSWNDIENLDFFPNVLSDDSENINIDINEKLNEYQRIIDYKKIKIINEKKHLDNSLSINQLTSKTINKI